jgi:hypothetical protein
MTSSSVTRRAGSTGGLPWERRSSVVEPLSGSPVDRVSMPSADKPAPPPFAANAPRTEVLGRAGPDGRLQSACKPRRPRRGCRPRARPLGCHVPALALRSRAQVSCGRGDIRESSSRQEPGRALHRERPHRGGARGSPSLRQRRPARLPPPAGGSRLQLSRCRWAGDPRPRDAGTHQGAGDPAGLDRRLDLPFADRPPPGHRTGRPRPQAIPLSRPLPQGPRRPQVRARPGVRAALPRNRSRVDEDLSRPGLPRPKVVAAVVRLLELTQIRVGNEEYARANRSYGLTTMRARHVDVDGSTIRFRFRGKNQKEADVDLRDRRLARVVARCPGAARSTAVPVPRRGRRPPVDRFGGRQRLAARRDGRGVHGQGFPDLGRDGAGGRCPAGHGGRRRRGGGQEERGARPAAARRTRHRPRAGPPLPGRGRRPGTPPAPAGRSGDRGRDPLRPPRLRS